MNPTMTMMMTVNSIPINEIYRLIKNYPITTNFSTITKDCVYICFNRANKNEIQYIQKALNRGVKYVIAPNTVSEEDSRIIKVVSPRSTLFQLAKLHRKALRGLKVLAITGSCGKTTTKNLVVNVLSKKYHVVCTPDNHNTYINTAETILNCKRNTDFAVIEMGAVLKEQIKIFCGICDPNYGVVTKIGKAHIGKFGSFENVKYAKSRLYAHLANNGGIAFVNSKDDVLLELSEELGVNKILFNEETTSTVRTSEKNPYLRIKTPGKQIDTQLIGEYNIPNVLCAKCIGEYFEIPEKDILSAIKSFKPENLRSEIRYVGENIIVVDTFNSNPTSCSSSLKSFAKQFSNKDTLVILGDMKELGDGNKLHLKVTSKTTIEQ